MSSPNMSLPIPSVSVTGGPEWATNINSCLTIVDAHTHAAGSGVQVTPDGLDINSDLTFQDNNLTDARSIRLQVQPSPISGVSDKGCLYVSGVDLYYNDENSNQIRITQGGGIAGSPGSIANLTPPASASYSAAGTKFIFQSAANTAAFLDSASLIIRNTTPSSFGLTLQAPTLGSNYSLTLPQLPTSQKIMTLDASGIMSASWTTDTSGTPTITVSGNALIVPAGGITTTQLATSVGTSANTPSTLVKRGASGEIAVGYPLIVGATNDNAVIRHGGTAGRLILDGDSGQAGGEIILEGSTFNSASRRIIMTANSYRFDNILSVTALTLSSGGNLVATGNITATGTIGGSNYSGTSSGTNTGDQTITLTGDVTGSGTGSFATTIASQAVTTGKIADANVTGAKIAANTVTTDKLVSTSIIGGQSGTVAAPAGSWTTITNTGVFSGLTVGRRILIFLTADDSGGLGSMVVTGVGGVNPVIDSRIILDGALTLISLWRNAGTTFTGLNLGGVGEIINAPDQTTSYSRVTTATFGFPGFVGVFAATASAHQFDFQVQPIAGCSAVVSNCRLVAYEI